MMREIEWNLDLLNALSRIWKERHQTTKNLEDFYIHYALDQLADRLPGELEQQRAVRAAERAQIHQELAAVKERRVAFSKEEAQYICEVISDYGFDGIADCYSIVSEPTRQKMIDDMHSALNRGLTKK